jgi:D-tyrosyl-tRNA(Tyr) deacylase
VSRCAACQDAFVRAVVQRVDGARVLVAGQVVGAIEGPGLLVLVGVTHDDTTAAATALADKIFDLRIFAADRLRDQGAAPDGPREVSASDVGLPVLVVSQFTLYGSTRKGRRPTWDAAAPAEVAEPLVDAVVTALRARGAEVATGVFGADMRVELVNDGPTTLIVDV